METDGITVHKNIELAQTAVIINAGTKKNLRFDNLNKRRVLPLFAEVLLLLAEIESIFVVLSRAIETRVKFCDNSATCSFYYLPFQLSPESISYYCDRSIFGKLRRARKS